MATAKSVFQIPESDLLCKKGCGFYGNPNWQGYCSKCWREYSKQKQSVHHESFNAHVDQNNAIANEHSPSLAFSKFEKKKKHQTDRKSSTLRSILKKGSPTKDASPHRKDARRRHFSAESREAQEAFVEFLRKLPRPVADELSQMATTVVKRVRQNPNIPAADLSLMMQDFYQILSERLQKLAVFKDCMYSIEEILIATETFLTTFLYRLLFCPANTDDEEMDLTTQTRIRKLNWVTCGFLKAGINERNPLARDKLDLAITEIIEMNSRRAPQDKLLSIVRCSKFICESLKESRGSPASADEFMPALIYVILRANPPLLRYYFVNLSCALKHICEDLNAQTLEISPEEFEDYMEGRSVPSNAAHFYTSDALRTLEQVLDSLKELDVKKNQFADELTEFNAVVARDFRQIFDKYDACLSKCRPKRGSLAKESSFDGEICPESSKNLPPPLAPVIISPVPSPEPEDAIGIDDNVSVVVSSTEPDDKLKSDSLD